MDTPRRRWFAFSLRTPFVVVLVLSCPLGCLAWQERIASRRLALLSRIKSDGGNYCSFGDQPIWGPDEYSLDVPGGYVVRVPFVRRCFGDRSIHCINLPEDLSEKDFADLTAAFPEAALHKAGSWQLFH